MIITVKLKRNLFKIGSICLIAALVMFESCNDDTASQHTSTVVSANDSATSQKPLQLSYSLPSAIQIASLYKRAGMAYREGVTSPQKDPSIYSNNVSKALNMGVYSADMSYSLLNGQSHAVVEYMKLSKQMADNLSIGDAFSAIDLIKRVEKNIANGDSLTSLVSDLQFEIDFYLDENNKQEITPIAFSGAWIETLYIGSKVNESRKDEILNSTLTDQMAILNSIIKSLQSVESKDKAISTLVADMQSIQNTFDGLPSVKEHKKENNPEKKIVLEGNEIQELSKVIETLRFKFIKG